MAVKLNLLPPGYGVSGTLGKALKTTRMLGVITLGAFLVFVLGLAAYFIFTSASLRNLTAENNTLKSRITAQSESEQRVVLVKDRVKKIKTVRTIGSSAENLEKIEALVSSLPENVSLTELSVDAQKIDLAVNITSNSALTGFLNTLKESEVFKSVVLTSFGFSPVGGYLANIRII